MSKLKRMKPILDFAVDKEQQAMQDLSKAKTKLEEQQQQLMALEQYRGEYHQNLHSTGLHGMLASDLQRYYQFINHLNKAISEQNDIVFENQDNVTQHRNMLIAANQRKEMLSILVKDLQQSEQKHMDKLEQKEIEQLLQAKYHRRHQDS